jgi:hypothetical protein
VKYLVKFTAPNGDPIYIVARWITRIRKASADELGHTCIFLGATMQTVQERIEQVIEMLTEDETGAGRKT